MSQEAKNLYVHFSFGAHGLTAVKTELPQVVREARAFFANPIPGQVNIFYNEDSSGRAEVVEFQRSLIKQGTSLLEAGAQGGYFKLKGIPADPIVARRAAQAMLRSKESTFGIHLVDSLDRIRGKNGVNFEWDSEAYPDEVTTERMLEREKAKGHYERARIALYSGDYVNAAKEGRISLVSEQADIAFRNDAYVAIVRKAKAEADPEGVTKLFLRVGTDHDILYDRIQRQGILLPPQLSRSYTRPVLDNIRRRVLDKIEQSPWAIVEDEAVLAYMSYVELINSESQKSKKGFADTEVDFYKRYPGITEDMVIEVFQRIVASAGSKYKERAASIKSLVDFDS